MGEVVNCINVCIQWYCISYKGEDVEGGFFYCFILIIYIRFLSVNEFSELLGINFLICTGFLYRYMGEK